METNENELDEKNDEKIQGEEDIFVHTRPNSVNKFERKQSQIPTENEINAALVQMISKGVCPPEYMHPYIFTSLNRRRVDAICKSDYDEAEKMDKISEMLTQSIKNSQINNDNQLKGEILYERFCKINENVQEINEKYDKKKEAILNESEKRKQEATEKYNNTEKEIYEKFQNPEYLQKYGKPSNRLSELREQEREYAMQRKYKEAREVKTEADEIERQETEVAQEKVSKQETLELEMNYKNYQKELQLIELRQNEQISLNESDRERELRPLEAALKQIRSKKPILPPLRPQSNLSEQSANSNLIAHIKPSSKMQSPRTQMKLRQMRTEKRVTLLAVKPQPTTKRDQQRLSRLQGTQARSSKVTSRNKQLKLPPMKGGRTQRATTRSQQAKAEKKNEQKENIDQQQEQQNEQENIDQQKHEEQLNEDQQQQEQENAEHQQNNEQQQLHDESSTAQGNVEDGNQNHEENNVSSEQQPQQDDQQNEGETSVDHQSTNENINSNESLNKENLNSTEQTNEEKLNQENQNNEQEQTEQQKEIINNEQQETSGEQNN